MVAYSFKKRFVDPIRVGLGVYKSGDPDTALRAAWPAAKCQTIRADRKRHARVGEELQLYCGMRTKGCFPIGRARCTSVLPIELHFIEWGSAVVGSGKVAEHCYFDERLHVFAQADGFENWEAMKAFWREQHPGIDQFRGWLIQWKPLAQT